MSNLNDITIENPGSIRFIPNCEEIVGKYLEKYGPTDDGFSTWKSDMLSENIDS